MRPPPRGRYVALGSSFAAGPGISPPSPDRPAKARQSRRNYPHLLAQRCELDLVDVTSSGATVQDILRTSQFGQPPQITAVTAQTELVTITIGGNDIGYIPSMIAAALPSWMTKVPVVGHRLGKATAAAADGDRVARTAGSMGRVLAAVQGQAPHARILCVDYLAVLPPTYRDNLPFDESTYHRLSELAKDLDTAIAQASSEHYVELVPASAHSKTHHAWSEQPWTSGWTRPRPGGNAAFHPNTDGMSAVTDLIAGRLTDAS